MGLRFRVIWIAVFLAFVPAVALGARVNVILITLDTTRADRMGFLGSKRGLTPNLDLLAASSLVFTRAYSQVPLTTPSHATILTGTYPQFHQVVDAGLPLGENLPYAPQIFREAGYKTAAFVGSVILDPKNGGAPGFDRGFDLYDAGFHSRAPGEDRYQSLSRRGTEVVERALAWIKDNNHAPFFLWIHLYDPHAPYEPPEPFATRFREAAYDGEIAYSDFALGKLFDQLRQAKLYDESVIAFMSDHGEALGEHGERGHGIFLYDPTIHVPLVIKLPKPPSAGSRVDTRVELVDVLPTILDAVGIPTPKAVQGRSLVPVFRQASDTARSRESADRAAYSESDYPQRAFGWSPLRSLRTGKFLFVDAPRPELYDQSRDPAADHNLAPTASAVSDTLAAQLARFREQTSRAATAPPARLDPDQQDKLQALGYAASGGSSSASQAKGADPKDRISLANEMTEVYFAMEEFHNQEAIDKAEDVIAKDPTIAGAYGALGEAWMHMGRFKEALPALRKAAELQPDSAYARYQLGTGLIETGDMASAATELEKANAVSPQSPQVLYALAFAYVQTDRAAQAKKLLETVRELKPKYYDADLLLGFILLEEKNPAAALPVLKEATELQPNSVQPHDYLADVYSALGDQPSADRERALAAKLKESGNP